MELGSKAGALRQMLLDMLEDSQEIRRLCIVGRNCILNRNTDVECSISLDKQIAEGKCVTQFRVLLLKLVYLWLILSYAEEEEEIEMLLENYLHR